MTERSTSIVRALQEKQRLFTDNTGAVVIPELQAHDIDTLDDWSVAEFKPCYLGEKGRPQ